jgi:hypothetical protein
VSDERVWLRHVGVTGEEGHGGYFECPKGAVEHWTGMGWQPADEPPPEDNPVVVENLAAQRAAAAQAEAAGRKSSRRGGTAETKEG